MKYHITYSATVAGGVINGRCFLTCDEPINTEARVNEVEEAIRADHDNKTIKNVALLSWTELIG